MSAAEWILGHGVVARGVGYLSLERKSAGAPAPFPVHHRLLAAGVGLNLEAAAPGFGHLT